MKKLVRELMDAENDAGQHGHTDARHAQIIAATEAVLAACQLKGHRGPHQEATPQPSRKAITLCDMLEQKLRGEYHMDSENVSFSRPKLARFKVAYARAVKENKADFTFDGHDYLVGYAKYLIQYLEGILHE